MKKVLFVATIANHIVGFHTKFMGMFKRNGYEIHVAVGDEKEITEYCDKKFKIDLFRNPFKLKNLKGIFQLKKIIETEKYNVIHCHTPMGSVVARLAAKRARKKYGTRVIYTCHGFHFYKGASVINWLLFYPVEWYLSKYTDTMITINSEDFELAKKKFGKRCKDIRYVPGVGIDVKKFEFKMSVQDINEYRKKLGLDENDFILIFPARLDKNKNQMLLIEIMEELIKEYDNIHLLLPGRDELNGYYQRKIKEKNLNDRIHVLGYRTDIAKLIKISNISVSSSIREGLGLNLIEGIYCGIPVIAYDNRGHRDIVCKENGYLVKDKDEFIKKIKEVMNNHNMYNIDNMRKSVYKFEYDNVMNEMKKIYDLERK